MTDQAAYKADRVEGDVRFAGRWERWDGAAWVEIAPALVTQRTPEDVIAEALVWAGGKGARDAAPRFPDVYLRRAELIAQALREAGMLNG